MEAAEKISVGVIKEKTKSKAVKKEAEGMRVSTREKVCYGVGDIGANLVWTTVASFLTIYCTDVAGIAAGVVGTLMLIARLFDGVSDLFMGVLLSIRQIPDGERLVRGYYGVHLRLLSV